MTQQDKKWITPKLEELPVEKTLTGPFPLDQEAVFQSVDQHIGGPPS